MAALREEQDAARTAPAQAVAVVVPDLVTAPDEVQPSARARSEPVPLLHSLEASGAAGAIEFHATRDPDVEPIGRAARCSFRLEGEGGERCLQRRTRYHRWPGPMLQGVMSVELG
jgi:hypothetical protein